MSIFIWRLSRIDFSFFINRISDFFRVCDKSFPHLDLSWVYLLKTLYFFIESKISLWPSETWPLWRIDFLTSILRISLMSSRLRSFIPERTSEKSLSNIFLRFWETKMVSLLLTLFSDIWNYLLPPKCETKSGGILWRKS